MSLSSDVIKWRHQVTPRAPRWGAFGLLGRLDELRHHDGLPEGADAQPGGAPGLLGKGAVRHVGRLERRTGERRPQLVAGAAVLGGEIKVSNGNS